MTTKTFELSEEDNPWQLGFFECREEVAGFTGGFGNGKTSVMGVLACYIAENYEEARVLVGRATRPKLEDSTKPEILKWVPEDSVSRWPSERWNNIEFKATGSRIEFRHVRQEGKGKGEEQSNLLSATYDAIFIDQMDDPEFSYKDFADLFGRLRGTAKYIGDDPSFPRFGPQYMRFGANPTRNWLYREVCGPFFLYEKSGLITPKLLIDPDTRKPIIKIFNAPSQANKKHTGERFSKRMEIVFRGAMNKRYIAGDWDAYEGLVYPDYDDTVHMVEHGDLTAYIKAQLANDSLGVAEGYDYGQVVPSCYALAFFNEVGDVFIIDGFYEANALVKKQAKWIKEIRNEWQVIPTEPVFADPQLFKKTSAQKDVVAQSITSMFEEEGIVMQRGANDIASGIEKVGSYLAVDKMHLHPVKRTYGAPRIYVSSKLDWWHNEIADYYWNKNIAGQNVDKPMDRNDHAMDMTKYLLTKRNRVVGQIQRRRRLIDPRVFNWSEVEDDRRGRILPRHM
jgi:hypothetical protein